MEKKESVGRVISEATLDRYLAAILVLRRRVAIVRSVDVAGYLGYSKARVCVAVKQMIREALVLMERHGALVLSETGERRARAHMERLEFIRALLRESGVEDDAARADADAIVRAISRTSFEALRAYLSRRGVEAPSAMAEQNRMH